MVFGGVLLPRVKGLMNDEGVELSLKNDGVTWSSEHAKTY